MVMRFWHRPLRAMLEAFQATGFTLETITEPSPDPGVADRFPDAYGQLSTRPQFIFFAAHSTPA